MSRQLKIIVSALVVVVVGFLVIQIIPVGSILPGLRFPGNPPARQQFQWDSPQTEQLMKAACYDCHSNETRYPWYATIAPVSWLVNHDINEGRDSLNFSTLAKENVDVNDIVDHIQSGDMPKSIYLPMHPEARLTDEQKAQLIAGIRATFLGR